MNHEMFQLIERSGTFYNASSQLSWISFDQPWIPYENSIKILIMLNWVVRCGVVSLHYTVAYVKPECLFN